MADERGRTQKVEPSEKPESGDWRRQASGLYVPAGTPEGGKKPPVGFARALQEKH